MFVLVIERNMMKNKIEKRKADETLREQEEKKQKTITVGEGEEVILIEEDLE